MKEGFLAKIGIWLPFCCVGVLAQIGLQNRAEEAKGGVT